MLRRRSQVQRMMVRSAVMAGIMILAGMMFPPESAVWVHFLLFVILFLVLRPI